ncbi:phage integrase N-terminal SAM-like domain-containing protein [Derxia gummosa]|uniref:Phage integrase N-terminal SAM-like domain-containing protein n=1 Tax=Derxia gummosa DSM 723 TaxID=1121388 RepID=A0AC36KLG8_9BURK
MRLLDQVRERIRYLHYSLKTERAYCLWEKAFVRFHGLRHPREMGLGEVEAFLTHLAADRGVSASTHRQALSALLFLYRQVLGVDLPWLDDIGRPKARERLPVVLSQQELARLFGAMPPAAPATLAARLLYGTGMRLLECLRLRVKDVDFDRGCITVRDCMGALPA